MHKVENQKLFNTQPTKLKYPRMQRTMEAEKNEIIFVRKPVLNKLSSNSLSSKCDITIRTTKVGFQQHER